MIVLSTPSSTSPLNISSSVGGGEGAKERGEQQRSGAGEERGGGEGGRKREQKERDKEKGMDEG